MIGYGECKCGTCESTRCAKTLREALEEAGRLLGKLEVSDPRMAERYRAAGNGVGVAVVQLRQIEKGTLPSEADRERDPLLNG